LIKLSLEGDIEACRADRAVQRRRNHRKGILHAEERLLVAIEAAAAAAAGGSGGDVASVIPPVVKLPGGSAMDSVFMMHARAPRGSRGGEETEQGETSPSASAAAGAAGLAVPSRVGAEDALALLLGSQRCIEELSQLRHMDYQAAWPDVPGAGGVTGMPTSHLILQGCRPIPRWAELRLFISHGHLTCACQRFPDAYEALLHRDKDSLRCLLQEWYLEEVRPALYGYATEDSIIDIAMIPDDLGRYPLEVGAGHTTEPFAIIASRSISYSSGPHQDGLLYDWSCPKDRLVLTYGPFEVRLAHKPLRHIAENEIGFHEALLNGHQGRTKFDEGEGRYTG